MDDQEVLGFREGGEGLDSCSSESRVSGGRVLSEDVWIVAAS